MQLNRVTAAALSLAGFCAISTATQAAERGTNWSGFYAGLNAGYGVAGNPTSYANSTFVTTETFPMTPAGVLGGIQFGYNWQWAQWVIGFETDLQFANQKDNACMLRCIGAIATAEIDQKLSWFGTTRGRFGWSTGSTLLYGTAGLAYGRIENRLTRFDGANPVETYNFSHTKTGWAAGLGFETALAGGWSAKAEYLRVDLGSISDTYMHVGVVPENLVSSVRNNVFRAGVNYRFFDTGRAYASAAPAASDKPAHIWDGIYAGLNIGYGAGQGRSSFTAAGFQPHNESLTLNPNGALGGAQIGFNRQFAPHWVAGLETDIQLAAQNSSETCAVMCSPATPIYVDMGQTLKWFGTVRGRLGVTTGPALIYGTGGFAYGRVDTHANYFASGFIGTNPTAMLDMSGVKTGWTVGGGIESALAGAWTVKLEYLYLDLGGTRSAGVTNDFGLGFTNVASASTQFRESLVRLGVNYKIQ